MKAYDRKARNKKAKAFILNEARALLEHSDLESLRTLHEVSGFGRTKLERFYRGFQDTYDDYKRRYLASNESTICGDRTDTDIMKRHLLQFGFDYDKYEAELVFPKPVEDAYTSKLMGDRAIVLREALPVMEHANLVSLITLHDLEGFAAVRLERYFVPFQKRYYEFLSRYMALDPRTLNGALTKDLKAHLLGIGFDYDALVNELVRG